MNKELVRVELTKFLQWNDRNGSYIDEECKLEGIDPLSYEDSICYFYYNVFEYIYNENGYSSPGELEYYECMNIARDNNLEFKASMYIEKIITYGLASYEYIINRIKG